MARNMTLNIEELIARLDNVFSLIEQDADENENTPELQAQALLYASFLTDIKEGRISTETDNAIELIELVQEFCKLIEVREDN